MGRETVSVFAILCFESSAPKWSAKSEAEVTMGLEAMPVLTLEVTRLEASAIDTAAKRNT
jgi:hypothetical protein